MRFANSTDVVAGSGAPVPSARSHAVTQACTRRRVAPVRTPAALQHIESRASDWELSLVIVNGATDGTSPLHALHSGDPFRPGCGCSDSNKLVAAATSSPAMVLVGSPSSPRR